MSLTMDYKILHTFAADYLCDLTSHKSPPSSVLGTPLPRLFLSHCGCCRSSGTFILCFLQEDATIFFQMSHLPQGSLTILVKLRFQCVLKLWWNRVIGQYHQKTRNVFLCPVMLSVMQKSSKTGQGAGKGGVGVMPF